MCAVTPCAYGLAYHSSVLETMGPKWAELAGALRADERADLPLPDREWLLLRLAGTVATQSAA